MPTNQPSRPLPTGITGWRKATASDPPLPPLPNLRTPAETSRNSYLQTRPSSMCWLSNSKFPERTKLLNDLRRKRNWNVSRRKLTISDARLPLSGTGFQHLKYLLPLYGVPATTLFTGGKGYSRKSWFVANGSVEYPTRTTCEYQWQGGLEAWVLSHIWRFRLAQQGLTYWVRQRWTYGTGTIDCH